MDEEECYRRARTRDGDRQKDTWKETSSPVTPAGWKARGPHRTSHLPEVIASLLSNEYTPGDEHRLRSGVLGASTSLVCRNAGRFYVCTSGGPGRPLAAQLPSGREKTCVKEVSETQRSAVVCLRPEVRPVASPIQLRLLESATQPHNTSQCRGKAGKALAGQSRESSAVAFRLAGAAGDVKAGRMMTLRTFRW